MRVFIAVLIGLVIAGAGWSVLRGLSRPVASPEPEAAVPVPRSSRVTYWCANCGTEVLLLRKGSDAAPRHCGEHMVRREEVARE